MALYLLSGHLDICVGVGSGTRPLALTHLSGGGTSEQGRIKYRLIQAHLYHWGTWLRRIL